MFFVGLYSKNLTKTISGPFFPASKALSSSSYQRLEITELLTSTKYLVIDKVFPTAQKPPYHY